MLPFKPKSFISNRLSLTVSSSCTLTYNRYPKLENTVFFFLKYGVHPIEFFIHHCYIGGRLSQESKGGALCNYLKIVL